MAFHYRAETVLPRTSDLEEKLVAHFEARKFRLVHSADGLWEFRRGHKMATIYRFDIRAYATTLQVRSEPSEAGKALVRFHYDVFTLLTVPIREDVVRLEADIADFISACSPLGNDQRDRLAALPLASRFLPLWVWLVIVFALLFATVCFFWIFGSD